MTQAQPEPAEPVSDDRAATTFPTFFRMKGAEEMPKSSNDYRKPTSLKEFLYDMLDSFSSMAYMQQPGDVQQQSDSVDVSSPD